MQLINLHDAATMLMMSPDTLQKRAKLGEIPGAKPGKCWVFLDVDLIEWLRTQYATHKKADAWESGSETVSGISRSNVTEKELFALLRPEKKTKRRGAG